MAVDLSQITGILRAHAPQMWVDAVARNPYLYNMIAKVPATGAKGSEWSITYSGAEATGFQEDDPLPAATQDDTLQAVQNAGYFRSILKITGHAEDALRNGDLVLLGNYLTSQMQSQIVGLTKTVHDAILGGADTQSGFVGLSSWFNNTGSIAGIDRATYPAASAFISSNGGTPRALTQALMNTVANGMVQTRQGSFNLVLGAINQVENFLALSAAAGGRPIHNFNVTPADTGSIALPVGFGSSTNALAPMARFRGADVVAVPGMATDRLWFIDWSTPQNIALEVVRNISVKELAPTDDNMRWQISVGLALRVTNPYKTLGAIVDLSA